MGLQATHLHIRRCNLKSSQLLLLLAYLSPPGAGVGVGGVCEQAQQPGGRRAGTPAPGAPPSPPEPEGGTPQDPWTLPSPSPELTPHPEQSKGVRKGPKESRGTKAGEQPWKGTKPHPLGLCPPHVSGCMLHFKKLCSPGQRLRASWLSTHHHQAQRQALNYAKDQLSHLPASLRVTRKINPEECSKKASNGRRLVSSWK